jgi:thiamine pyrophosphate-dependent acetolactate synthase large subunit-like protein
MTGLEMRTAIRLGLSLPVIVFDDGALGLIRLDQLLSSGYAHGTDLGRIDYEVMAAALGCAYAGADTSDIEQQIRIAVRRHGPTLIVVPVGDSPALRRARQRRFLGRAAKSLLGPRIVGALRWLRLRTKA